MKKQLNLFCLLVLMVLNVGFSASERQPTEILWDTYGIPHVFASSEEELFHAFGYAQMHNHANLILRLYGRARGRAAEYWGGRSS